ncbi:PepSY-associated TM helix domain-containing protein [Microbacteriaceae bacterium 4G12]
MKIRKLIGGIHLWLSMIAGVFIVLLGLTGSLLVFKPELNRLFHPSLYKVTDQPQVSYEQALQNVATAHPKGSVQRVYTPSEPNAKGIYLFQVKEGKTQTQIYVDPGTGKINGELGDKTLLNQITAFHHNLLLKDWNGDQIVGIIGFIFAFITLSGIYLWWPGIKKWKRGFTMRRSTNTYVKQYDLHKIIGGVSIPFLLLVSITGALFIYDEKLFGLFGAKAKVSPPKQVLVSNPLPEGKLPVDRLLHIAEESGSNGTVMQLRMPEKAKKGKKEGAVEVRLSRSYDPGNANVRMWLDAYSGKVLATLDPKVDQGLTYQTWRFPLHTGVFGGLFTKILYAIGGLTPTILMCTGTYMWWHKKRVKRNKKIATAA